MQALNRKIEQFRKKHGIAGLAVAVTNRTQTLYAAGFGTENAACPAQPETAHSLHRIASLTKLTTGLTILRLCEQGLLQLDTPVKAYVPWLALESKQATDRLTLRHLLSHRAGLPKEYTPEGPLDESALEPSLQSELPMAHLHGMPGEAAFLYSNLGIRLASLAAERVTQKRWSQLATELVLSPLGMQETAFYRQHLPLSVSLPHERDAQGRLQASSHIKENAARMAAGGLYSNAADLCKLARCLLNNAQNDAGVPIISPESFAQMCRAHGYYGASEGNDGYGLTMRLHTLGDRLLYGHFGSAPPYSSALYTHRESGLGAVLLLNSPAEPARDELITLLLDSFS